MELQIDAEQANVSEARLRAQIATLHWTLGSGHVRARRVAIDCGAYEGHWTEVMAQCFDLVIAFEPSMHNWTRLMARIGAKPNVQVHRAAVFSDELAVSMVESKSKHSAAHYVRVDECGDVNTMTIDGLALRDCDLIKLDVEGAEFDALKGASETITRCRPVLIVEMKGLETRFGHMPGSVARLLGKYRYRMVHSARPDFVFVPAP